MRRRVIISADDFGLAEGINRGIEDAMEQGALTATSLMGNTPGFADAVKRAKRHPKWSVGVHLNVIRGRPVLPVSRVRGLVEGESFKHGFMSLAVACLDSYVLCQVECEYRAQIEKIMASGIRPDHIDSEKHHHMIPGIFEIVLRLAHDYGIRFVRIAREMSGIPVSIKGNSPTLSQTAKAAFLEILGGRALKTAKKNRLQTNLEFWGLNQSGNMTLEVYEHFFRHFQGGIAEIMCHPGYETECDKKPLEEMGRWYLWQKREKELDALLDGKLKYAAEQAGIKLVSFGEL